MSQDFTLADFLSQCVQIRKMSAKDRARLMPGMPGFIAEEDPEVVLDRMRRMIDAMSDQERNFPEIVNSSSRSRIAAASGTQPHEVEQFLTQFLQVRALMRKMARMSFWQRLKLVMGFGKLPGNDGDA